MYCPALYCMRSVAGNCNDMMMTSSLTRSIFATREGSFLTGMSPAPITSRASMVTSVCGIAQQNKACPAVCSAADKARS